MLPMTAGRGLATRGTADRLAVDAADFAHGFDEMCIHAGRSWLTGCGWPRMQPRGALTTGDLPDAVCAAVRRLWSGRLHTVPCHAAGFSAATACVQ